MLYRKAAYKVPEQIGIFFRCCFAPWWAFFRYIKEHLNAALLLWQILLSWSDCFPACIASSLAWERSYLLRAIRKPRWHRFNLHDLFYLLQLHSFLLSFKPHGLSINWVLVIYDNVHVRFSDTTPSLYLITFIQTQLKSEQICSTPRSPMPGLCVCLQ